MRNNYSNRIDDELNDLYYEIDYNYDAMLDKDVNKELVSLYDELSDEMTFNYDDGPNNAIQRRNAALALYNEKENPVIIDADYYEDPNTFSEDFDSYENFDDSTNNSNPKKGGPKKPLPKEKKIVLSIVLTIAIGIFLISGLKLLSIKKGYDDGRNAYKKLDGDFFKGDTDNLDDLDWDFSELFAQNPDVAGYIYCPDVVSYPVVQGTDNDYYLRHLFTHDYNDSGSIFIDCNLPNKFESRNCIIYGHNMQDGSMFSKLLNYSRGDGYQYYQDHKEFHIFTTDDHHYVYKVIGAYTVSISSNIYATDLNDEQFLALLNEIQVNTPYETEHGELTVDSKIMTLSTCLDNSDDNYRHIVVLVRDREIPKKQKTDDKKNDTNVTVDE